MGGEGSMSSMRTILRNNKNLLRKKNIFSKGDNFKAFSGGNDKNAKTPYEIKETSKKELEAIRVKNAKGERKHIRNVVLLLILIAAISSLFFLQMNDFVAQRKAIAEDNRGYGDVYSSHMTMGDLYASRNKWSKAIKKYEEAINLLPEKYIAYNRLAYAMVKNCTILNRGCEKTKREIENMMHKFPDKKKELEGLLSRLEIN
ncbi:tetratricopeptide repeat protein [Wenyingzhuangia sp. IMCC45574]